MWVKLHHQPVKQGDLLSQGISKEDIYNKNIPNAAIVKNVEDGKYELEEFFYSGFMSVEPLDNISSVIPVDFPLTYEELVKGHWHLWID